MTDGEVWTTLAVEPSVRIHINAPADKHGKPKKATRLIVFALPNGNTLEQTLGCKLRDGLSWRYDIQHIAAQVRTLREMMPNENIVLIAAEGPGLSWPNFRRIESDPNTKIRALYDTWRKRFATKDARVTLTGHSGGGAFILGVIQGGGSIPNDIDRIAFLDANYSYDTNLHASKIINWIEADKNHRFIVLAYDDREIMLDGKKVVSSDGGTYRATGRMRDGLCKAFPFADSKKPPFNVASALDGRIRFYVHPNPQNKILHTALVGDMNGLLHIQTLGTPLEESWGTFGGERAFAKYIGEELVSTPPTPENKSANRPASSPPQNSPKKNSRSTALPPRPADAPGGTEFVRSIAQASLDDREAAILRELQRGNIPDFLRSLKKVPVRGTIKQNGKERTIQTTIEVMPDYLAIGGNDDFVRMPMTPQTAQRFADKFGYILPTRKLVDAIDAAAKVHLAPHPMTEAREAMETFVEHQQIIERQRGNKPLGQLVTGIKKDIVLTPRIFERPQRLAIYGWRQLDGKPIQPLTIVHWDRYVDYSHGARLVRNEITIDGKSMRIDEALTSPDLNGLVSDEGPMSPPHYPNGE